MQASHTSSGIVRIVHWAIYLGLGAIIALALVMWFRTPLPNVDSYHLTDQERQAADTVVLILKNVSRSIGFPPATTEQKQQFRSSKMGAEVLASVSAEIDTAISGISNKSEDFGRMTADCAKLKLGWLELYGGSAPSKGHPKASAQDQLNEFTLLVNEVGRKCGVSTIFGP